MALIVYERTPRFISSPSNATRLSAWDPYAVLALQRERASELVSLCKALRSAGSAEDAHACIQARCSRIRAAYRELAATYHPDAARASCAQPAGHALFTWITPYDQFAAISSAYRLLSDVVTTLEYHAACGGGAQCTSFLPDADGAQSHGEMLRELRVHRAAQERLALQEHIAAVRRIQMDRAAHGGDGLIIQLALYGDTSTLASLLSQIRGGQPFPPPAVLAALDRVIDVTDVLQGMVEITERDSVSESKVVQLVLPPSSKASLEGFWDPAEDAHKMLFLRYTFLHTMHEAFIDDEAGLKCPLKKHVVADAPAPVTAPSTAYKAAKPAISHAHTSLRAGDRSAVLGDASNVHSSTIRTVTHTRSRVVLGSSPHGKARGGVDVMNETENMTFHTPLSASFTSACSQGPDDVTTIAVQDAAAPVSVLLDVSCCNDRSRASTLSDETGVITFVKEVDALTGDVRITRGVAPVPTAASARATALAIRSARVARKLFDSSHGQHSTPPASSSSDVGVAAAAAEDPRELLRTLRERAQVKARALEADVYSSWSGDVVLFQIGGLRITAWYAIVGCGVAAAAVAGCVAWRRTLQLRTEVRR